MACTGCDGCQLAQRVAQLEEWKRATELRDAEVRGELARVWDSTSGRFRGVWDAVNAQGVKIGELQTDRGWARGAFWALQLLTGAGGIGAGALLLKLLGGG